MTENQFEISHCEICGNTNLRQILDLGKHPMCDDLVQVQEDRTCEEYPIEILFCSECVTAHQRFQVPKQLLFPKNYHYRSRNTSDVLNGMRNLVDSCMNEVGDLQGKNILDIGCNDGSLLSIFSEFGANTYGIEPTSAALDAVRRGKHTIVNDYFDQNVASKFVTDHNCPDIITFTNVFAHIEKLGDLIQSLKILIGPNTIVVIENHYLGAIIEKNQFDTFYHEHPRTYSATSFAYIGQNLGLDVTEISFPHRYGGNIRVLMKQGGESGIPTIAKELLVQEQVFEASLERFASNISSWIVNKKEEINMEVEKNGPLSAKAFPGRAAIAIKLLGLDTNHIKAVYEKPGSIKIGHYVPGTRIPIQSDDDFNYDERSIINLAWHISEEIASYMRGRGYDGKIIDIIARKDFT